MRAGCIFAFAAILVVVNAQQAVKIGKPRVVSQALPAEWSGTLISITADVDNEPPSCYGMDFYASQGPYNVTSMAVLVSFTSFCNDTGGSGLASVKTEFVSPSERQTLWAACVQWPSASYNHLCSFSIPTMSEPGQWKLLSLVATDYAGNAKTYTFDDFPLSFEVIDEKPDTEAPVVHSVSHDRDMEIPINRVRTGFAVSYQAEVTDDGSGVNSVGITVVSPSGKQKRDFNLVRFKGTLNNGTWWQGANFQTISEGGVWTIQSLWATDNVGNTRTYTAAEINALPGTPKQVSLSMQRYTQEPQQIVSITASPLTVDLTEKPVDFFFNVTLKGDQRAYVYRGTVWVVNEDDLSVTYPFEFTMDGRQGALPLVGGDTLWDSKATLTNYVTRPGKYKIMGVQVIDDFTNTRNYGTVPNPDPNASSVATPSLLLAAVLAVFALLRF